MSWETIASSRPKARKQHRCIWCPGHIEKGEVHVVQTGKFEGDFQSNRYHPECFMAMQKAIDGDSDGGFMPHENKRGQINES
jgi:hypothetical protein